MRQVPKRSRPRSVASPRRATSPTRRPSPPRSTASSPTLGPIEICFNNAGVATGGNPLATDVSVWHEQWGINVMSHVYAIRRVLPGMLERGEGYILHTASMAGILTSHGNATYATTKHAVVGLAEWMSITYHDRGVRTSLLAPLGVRTPMLDASSKFAATVAGPLAEPEDVADAGRRRDPRGAVPDPHRSDRADVDVAQDRGHRALAARDAPCAAATRGFTGGRGTHRRPDVSRSDSGRVLIRRGEYALGMDSRRGSRRCRHEGGPRPPRWSIRLPRRRRSCRRSAWPPPSRSS